jgi:hypothetical protein
MHPECTHQDVADYCGFTLRQVQYYANACKYLDLINEEVNGITKYALEHYEEIKQAYPNKPDEWILKVNKKSGYKYRIDESRAHIKSYELVKLVSSDKVKFSFEELQHLPTAL